MNDFPRVAAIQMASGAQLDTNLATAAALLRQAADAGALLAVLPENFAYMGKRDQDLLTLAERDGQGPLQDFLKTQARTLGLWLVGGTIPLITEDAERVRAATLIMDDQGQPVGRYDKIHLFDVDLPDTGERYQESATIEPGDHTLVLDTPLGRLGILVCYDLRFPEQARALQLQGLDLIALPAAFTARTGQAHWETLVRARAIENLSYVIAAAQGGDHPSGRTTYGHSMIVDPWGGILSEYAQGPGCITATINQDLQQRLRSSFPVLKHRR